MLLLVAALASFAVPGAVHGVHAHLLSAAMAVHFLKRVLEVRKKKPKSNHVFFLLLYEFYYRARYI